MNEEKQVVVEELERPIPQYTLDEEQEKKRSSEDIGHCCVRSVLV